jgi:hypothetical protein
VIKISVSGDAVEAARSKEAIGTFSSFTREAFLEHMIVLRTALFQEWDRLRR